MSVLSVATQKQVEDNLIAEGLATAAQLDDIRAKSKKEEAPLFGVLVQENIVSQEKLTQLIARATKVPYVKLTDARIDAQVLALLPQEIAERYMAVPLGEMQDRLVIAMLDADNVQAIDFLSNKIGRPLKVYAASEEGIRQVLKQYRLSLGKDLPSSLDDEQKEGEVVPESGEKGTATPTDKAKNIKTIVQDSPISKALTTILEYAATNRASDIHIEPLEKELRIRCRIDGVLREIMKLPKSTEPALVSRIKILSNLKIDEHRIPQDGTFTVKVGNNPIDLRIAISPVVWGEQVVIRLLDKTGTSLKLEDMGYAGRPLRTIRKGLEEPNGMILTSGPMAPVNLLPCML